MNPTTTNDARWLAEITRPNPTESDYAIKRIEGEIPRELNGTLYRNGPNQKVLPQAGAGALHLFDGDAMIHAITFDDGQARYRGRYARTESFERTEAENRYCLGGLNLPAEGPLEDPPPGIQPNTNVVPHSNRLFALVENAPPFEMDPVSLESKGIWDYDGKMLGMSTTAHPKIDGKTGQMWIHGYQPIPPFIQLYVVEPDGSVSLAEGLDAPWASMMHDFAISENHVIFPLGSMTFDLQPIMEGKSFNEALSGLDTPMKFGVRRREPGSEIVWIDAPSPGYMFHPGNAYEKDGKIYMDACTYENPQGLLDDLATVRNARGDYSGFKAHPYLYEFDLAAGTCKETKLSDISAEFPRIDDRRVGHENRYGYAATAEPGEGPAAVFRRITKYDRTGGASQNSTAVEGRWVGEPVFVPRSAEADEDDGFVLNLLHDGKRDETAVDILDARAIDGEPVARLWLEERLPLGFHGNWLGAS